MSKKPDLRAVGHEMKTQAGIIMSDPDQGTPYILVETAMPSVFLAVWEPFEEDDPEGQAGGHNLVHFLQRYKEWLGNDEAFLYAFEPRFGHPVAMPRSLIPHVTQIWISVRPNQDARAGARMAAAGIVKPGMRIRGDGAVEIQVPRSALER